MITTAKVATPHGIAYTRRLWKHFAHKIPAVIDDNHGRIEFPFGLCTIQCEAAAMIIRVELTDAAEANRAESVVGDHLLRMANKDKPVIIWQREFARGLENGS